MSAQIIVFFILAAIAVLGAISLILARHPIRSALSLIAVMVALAGLYLLQGAELVAAIQIIVYAGAIMVLFVIVIMLLNAGEEERTNMSRMARYVGLPLGFLLMLQLAWWVGRATRGMAPAAGVSPALTKGIFMLLFRNFALPFELTSILILVAILGAVVLAKRES